MTIISSDNVTAYIRSLVGEATAKHWEDDEIANYIKFGLMVVISRFWYMLAPSEAKSEAASLVASQAYVEQPDDCAKVLRVEVAETRDLLHKIEADELWKYSVYDDGAASADYLNIWYLEYPSEVTDVPEALRPLVAVEAALSAKIKDAGVRSDLMIQQKRFEDIANTFLSTDSMYEPTHFGDYEQEQAFTRSNPCAWIFKNNRIYLYKSYSD